jgi:hypothetical protein
MPSLTPRVAHLIVEALEQRERRVLSLVVAVRKALERTGVAKVDLRTTIDSTLSGLIESKTVKEADGVYSLVRGHRIARGSRSRSRSGSGSGSGGSPGLAPDPQPNPGRPQVKSREDRNKAATRKDSVRVEQYLTDFERAHGFAKAWALRERLEHGHVTLDELRRR